MYPNLTTSLSGFLSPQRMALQTVNVSLVEVPEGCAERGNLSVEVTDYNISCTNGSVLQRPPVRVKGKTTYLPVIYFISQFKLGFKCILCI